MEKILFYSTVASKIPYLQDPKLLGEWMDIEVQKVLACLGFTWKRDLAIVRGAKFPEDIRHYNLDRHRFEPQCSNSVGMLYECH